MNKKIVCLLLSLFTFITAFAQDKEAEMADVLRENGKIYNVVAVLGIILVGLFVYLILTERKLAKIEAQLRSK